MAARSLQRSVAGVRMFFPAFPATRAAVGSIAAKGMSTQAEADVLFCRVHSAMVGSIDTLKETPILQRALTIASSTPDEAKDDVGVVDRWHRVLGAMESIYKEAAVVAGFESSYDGLQQYLQSVTDLAASHPRRRLLQAASDERWRVVLRTAFGVHLPPSLDRTRALALVADVADALSSASLLTEIAAHFSDASVAALSDQEKRRRLSNMVHPIEVGVMEKHGFDDDLAATLVERRGAAGENFMPECTNTHCPWSGDPVQPTSLAFHEGRVIGFCNPGCRDKFVAATTAFDSSAGIAASTPDVAGVGWVLARVSLERHFPDSEIFKPMSRAKAKVMRAANLIG